MHMEESKNIGSFLCPDCSRCIFAPRQVEPRCGPTCDGAKMHQPRHTAMLCNPSRLTYIIQVSHAWISLAKLSNNSAHAGRAKRDPSGHTSMGRLVLHHLRLLFGSHFCPRTHAPASVSAACEAAQNVWPLHKQVIHMLVRGEFFGLWNTFYIA